MNCVCGHPEDAHEPVVLSVPLIATTNAYPVMGPIWCGGVDRFDPNATYDGVACWCGCSSFEPDPVDSEPPCPCVRCWRQRQGAANRPSSVNEDQLARRM